LIEDTPDISTNSGSGRTRLAIVQLKLLIDYRGRARVTEILGVDGSEIDALLSGERHWTEDIFARLQETLDTYRRQGMPIEVEQESADEDHPEPPYSEPETQPVMESSSYEIEDAEIQNWMAEVVAPRDAEVSPGVVNTKGRTQDPGFRKDADVPDILRKARRVVFFELLRESNSEYRLLLLRSILTHLEARLIHDYGDTELAPGADRDPVGRKRALDRRTASLSHLKKLLDKKFPGWAKPRTSHGSRRFPTFEDELYEIIRIATGPGYSDYEEPFPLDPDDFLARVFRGARNGSTPTRK